MGCGGPELEVGCKVGYWLLAIGCWLLAVSCGLLVVGCGLLAGSEIMSPVEYQAHA